MATGGRTPLVRGDLAGRTVSTLRQNVECPSLSPDGTRVVFKKRVAGLPAEAPWRLHVLDPASGKETPLAEGAAWTTRRCGRTMGRSSTPCPGTSAPTCTPDRPTAAEPPARLLESALVPAFLG